MFFTEHEKDLEIALRQLVRLASKAKQAYLIPLLFCSSFLSCIRQGIIRAFCCAKFIGGLYHVTKHREKLKFLYEHRCPRKLKGSRGCVEITKGGKIREVQTFKWTRYYSYGFRKKHCFVKWTISKTLSSKIILIVKRKLIWMQKFYHITWTEFR